MSSRVSFSAGFTRNMGDFESLRIDIGLEDSPLGEESNDAAYNRIKDFVESRLLDEIAAVEAEIVNIRNQVRESGSYKRKVKKAAEAD